jgi:hypothetical protein
LALATLKILLLAGWLEGFNIVPVLEDQHETATCMQEIAAQCTLDAFVSTVTSRPAFLTFFPIDS